MRPLYWLHAVTAKDITIKEMEDAIDRRHRRTREEGPRHNQERTGVDRLITKLVMLLLPRSLPNRQTLYTRSQL